jgi:hypothetical protein
VTGEAFGYNNWPDGEPNNWGGDERYIAFDHGFSITDGKVWNDLGVGGTNYGFIVEYESVPEPSTMLLLGSGLVGLVAFRKRFKRA